LNSKNRRKVADDFLDYNSKSKTVRWRVMAWGGVDGSTLIGSSNRTGSRDRCARARHRSESREEVGTTRSEALPTWACAGSVGELVTMRRVSRTSDEISRPR